MDIFESLEQNFYKMVSIAELDGVSCMLHHGPEHLDDKEHPAVDYLCQGFGDMVNGIVHSMIRIPVCEECANALYDVNWLLMYCVNCNESQWIDKRFSKKEYAKDDHVMFLKWCPNCYEEGISDLLDE